MRLQRYTMGDYCSGYVKDDDGEVCMNRDVEALEQACEDMLKILEDYYLQRTKEYAITGEYHIWPKFDERVANVVKRAKEAMS